MLSKPPYSEGLKAKNKKKLKKTADIELNLSGESASKEQRHATFFIHFKKQFSHPYETIH